ncbi:DUF4296 domain-containing protein [Lacinutrix sp. MedPE-SW]|uniref:DUF4296 domain-containing protein n=1 Tax=Lacinutrix sp. MedPE-SW TaxID=1860087 RepID=UPI000918E157|nr:DUF4296 domain-containing protein [Lacinutrix sp. MedPE-SW]OIQ20288.1 MAG: hypothetical protein BM549_10200 [Lacinutrix sp. MedPE-SW]
MKLKLFTISLVFLLLTSCYKVDKPSKPDNLLTEKEMVAILVDMAIMSSAKGINKKKIEENGITPNVHIFKKHNIDSVRFSQSNNYYAYDIKEYNNIYVQVKDSLEALREKYKTIEVKEKKEKAKQDSLKKIKAIKTDSVYKLKGKASLLK